MDFRRFLEKNRPNSRIYPYIHISKLAEVVFFATHPGWTQNPPFPALQTIYELNHLWSDGVSLHNLANALINSLVSAASNDETTDRPEVGRAAQPCMGRNQYPKCSNHIYIYIYMGKL